MGKIVILEGPDGSGKTLLADELVKLGWKYRHEGPPPEDKNILTHYLEVLNESIESPHNIVHDRLWLGERIYGPVARGYDRLGDEGQKLMLRLHYSKPIIQYVCLPPYVIAMTNYQRKIKESSDYLKSTQKYISIYDSYLRWYGDPRTRTYGLYDSNTMLYDYTKSTLRDVREEIVKMKDHYLPKGTVGSRLAEILFIGDKPNHPFVDVPFHATTGSSGYLNSALDLAGLKEYEIALSNAFSPLGDKHDFLEIVRCLPNLRKVFLMGAASYNWYKSEMEGTQMSEFNFEAYAIYHPSYLKRFKGHNPQIMADIITRYL